MHHWEFPLNKKIIPMLTCPIGSNTNELQKLFENAKKLSHYLWKEVITIAENIFIALVGG